MMTKITATIESKINAETYNLIACGLWPSEAADASTHIGELMSRGVSRDSAVLVIAKCSVNFGAVAGDVVDAIQMAVDAYQVPAQSVAAMLSKDANRARGMGLTLHEAARASAKRVVLEVHR